MMRTGLLVALLVACLALFWSERNPATRPVQADRISDAASPVPLAVPAAGGRAGVESAAAKASPAVATDAAVELPDLASMAMHLFETSQPCLAGTAGSAKVEKVAIHRWVDDAGIVHFSDQGPSGEPVEGYRRIEVDGLPPVVVNATGYDVNLPDQLAQRATADAMAIARVLRDILHVQGDPGLVLTIEFVGSAESYASRVANPAMAASDGTYSSADGTIRVRLQPDIESNFLILRHEITHALLHERVGHLSTPVNEGLAGYFERVEVSGLGAQVSLDESRLSIGDAAVSTDGSAELVDLLARDGVLFYAEGREQRYVHAFAMVAVLMGTPDGRQALIDLLAAQRAQPCVPVDAALVFDASYPGGLLALAADWSRWLRDPPRSVQSF